MKNWWALLEILFVIGVSVGFYFYSVSYEPYVETEDNYVVRVIDGDSFELGNGEFVRLICVDAPEEGEGGYFEAREFLKELVFERVVRLEKDVSEVDDYGRLLRYVYVEGSEGEIFVNRELVRAGHARVYPFEPDIRLCEEISGGGG